jgi:hypothetical protein
MRKKCSCIFIRHAQVTPFHGTPPVSGAHNESMKIIRNVIFVLALSSIALATSACPEKGPAEKAGEKIDNAIDKTKDAAKDATK